MRPGRWTDGALMDLAGQCALGATPRTTWCADVNGGGRKRGWWRWALAPNTNATVPAPGDRGGHRRPQRPTGRRKAAFARGDGREARRSLGPGRAVSSLRSGKRTPAALIPRPGNRTLPRGPPGEVRAPEILGANLASTRMSGGCWWRLLDKVPLSGGPATSNRARRAALGGSCADRGRGGRASRSAAALPIARRTGDPPVMETPAGTDLRAARAGASSRPEDALALRNVTWPAVAGGVKPGGVDRARVRPGRRPRSGRPGPAHRLPMRASPTRPAKAAGPAAAVRSGPMRSRRAASAQEPVKRRGERPRAQRRHQQAPRTSPWCRHGSGGAGERWARPMKHRLRSKTMP